MLQCAYVLNAYGVCVLPVVNTRILSCYIILYNVCYTTDAVDHIYKFELSPSFEFGVVSIPHVQRTILYKIHLSYSITISVKGRCR